MTIKIAKYLLVCLVVVFLAFIINRFIKFTEIKVYKYPTSGPAEIALSDAISSHKLGEIPVVDLSKVTTFSWDRLYIFEPYTKLSKIDNILGKSWRDSCFTTIDSYEGFALLVFTSNRQVVSCIEHPRDMGDFAAVRDHELGFSNQEARFIMNETGQMIWVGNK